MDGYQHPDGQWNGDAMQHVEAQQRITADEPAAAKLADHLTRRYRTANVLLSKSPAGDWWIRVRVLDDDHDRAQKLVDEMETPEGAVFLVRLD